MANYIVQDTSLAAVADAIRAKAGGTEKLVFPAGFVDAVEGIQSGGGGSSHRNVNTLLDFSGMSATVLLPAATTSTIIAAESKATYVKKYENISAPADNICTIDGSNDWVYRTFLQHDFSAIPTGSVILSATLKMYVAFGNDNYKSSQCYIGRMLGDWAEDASLTWANQPSHQGYSSGSSATPQVSPAIGASNWVEVDITDIVKQWCDGSAPNYGIVIRAITEGSYRYNWNIRNRRYSDEYATKVEVTYRPFVEPVPTE